MSVQACNLILRSTYATHIGCQRFLHNRLNSAWQTYYAPQNWQHQIFLPIKRSVWGFFFRQCRYKKFRNIQPWKTRHWGCLPASATSHKSSCLSLKERTTCLFILSAILIEYHLYARDCAGWWEYQDEWDTVISIQQMEKDLQTYPQALRGNAVCEEWGWDERHLNLPWWGEKQKKKAGKASEKTANVLEVEGSRCPMARCTYRGRRMRREGGRGAPTQHHMNIIYVTYFKIFPFRELSKSRYFSK